MLIDTDGYSTDRINDTKRGNPVAIIAEFKMIAEKECQRRISNTPKIMPARKNLTLTHHHQDHINSYGM